MHKNFPQNIRHVTIAGFLFYLVKYTNDFFFIIIVYLLSLENVLVLAFMNIPLIFSSYFKWSNCINLRSYAMGSCKECAQSCKKENKHVSSLDTQHLHINHLEAVFKTNLFDKFFHIFT